nr:hypothetical protein [Tanacetum cinerariifolium]
VANAARNYEILHERDDEDTERPEKRFACLVGGGGGLFVSVVVQFVTFGSVVLFDYLIIDEKVQKGLKPTALNGA